MKNILEKVLTLLFIVGPWAFSLLHLMFTFRAFDNGFWSGVLTFFTPFLSTLYWSYESWGRSFGGDMLIGFSLIWAGFSIVFKFFDN